LQSFLLRTVLIYFIITEWTLIALEEKAVEKDQVLKWDGHIYDIPDCNHDQTLKSLSTYVAIQSFQL
jgi:beta-lactamase class D